LLGIHDLNAGIVALKSGSGQAAVTAGQTRTYFGGGANGNQVLIVDRRGATIARAPNEISGIESDLDGLLPIRKKKHALASTIGGGFQRST
jgi:hypothetical protein